LLSASATGRNGSIGLYARDVRKGSVLMRRYLVLAVAVAILSAVLITGGCQFVPKSQLLACQAANARVQRSLDEALASTHRNEAENNRLLGTVKARDAALLARGQELATLTDQYGKLKASFDDLSSRYREAARDQGTLVLDGPLPVGVDRALRAFEKNNPGLLKYLPKYGMVKFKSDLTFGKGMADVGPAATEALGKLVEILQSPAAVKAKLGVYIAGHTDDIRIAKPTTREKHPTNWYLSVHRAIGVQKALTHAGLAPRRIAVMGFGEYQPVAPNRKGPGGKKLGNPANRRVEIWIVPTSRFLVATTESAPTFEK